MLVKNVSQAQKTKGVRTMAYEVLEPQQRIEWDLSSQSYTDVVIYPTLAEVIAAAEKEFPGIPFEELGLSGYGNDDYCENVQTLELFRK